MRYDNKILCSDCGSNTDLWSNGCGFIICGDCKKKDEELNASIDALESILEDLTTVGIDLSDYERTDQSLAKIRLDLHALINDMKARNL